MTDERRPDEPSIPDEEGAQPKSGAVPEQGATVPIVPRQLPPAAAFFGEPRTGRHSARAEPASTPEPDPSPEPDPAPEAEPESTAPHPMALDLSALRGQRDDSDASEKPIVEPVPWSLTGEQPALDVDALPPHDGVGETPTAAFGAVFGDAPHPPVSSGPRDSPEPPRPAPEASFTELLSVPADTPPPTSEPASFNWADLAAPAAPVEPASPAAEAVQSEADTQADSAAEPDDRTQAFDVLADRRSPVTDQAPPVTWLPPAPAPSAETPAELPAEPDAHAPSSESGPETDPVRALFGDIVEPEPEPAPSPSESKTDAQDSARSEARPEQPAVEPDSAWADVPRDPAPAAASTPVWNLDTVEPASPIEPASPADSPAAPEPRRSDDLPPTEALTAPFLPSSPVVPQADAADAATRAFVVPPVLSEKDARGSDTLAPSGVGASRRAITPIDPTRVPESWSAAAPFAPAPTPTDGGTEGPTGTGGGFASWPRQRKTLLFVGIALAFLIVLGALYFTARFIVSNAAAAEAPVAATAPSASAPASPKATPKASATPTPSPSSTAAAGPASAGVHQWSDLRGGECLSSFTDAWQQTYTVVDCSGSHAAQLVATGAVAGAAGSAYPGLAALEAQVAPKCQSSDVINMSAAQAYTGVQVSASYPATTEQWAAGSRTYYCFVSRTGGQTFTSSLKAG